MSTPRVTIGLPVYNGANFLDEAIRSIRDQTFQDLHLVVSDNGSTDATEEIARTHASEDARIRYERSDVNRGACWNYTRTFELAVGPYFKWAAHDDVILPTYLERTVEVLDSDPEVGLAHTRVLTVNEHDEPWDGPQHPANSNGTEARPSERFAAIVYRERRCYPVFGLIRRELLAKTKLLGPYPSHDRPLLAELALHAPFRQVDEHLYIKRRHPQTSMNAYAHVRDRVAWFDPSREGKYVSENARLILEMERALRRVGLPVREAVRARYAIAKWALRTSPRTIGQVTETLRYRLGSALLRGADGPRETDRG